MSILKNLSSLLNSPEPTKERANLMGSVVAASSVSKLSAEHNSMLRVEIIPALNGRILQIGKFKPNPHGPDWTYELYIVPDDQSLTDAISAVLVMRGV